MTDCEVWRPVVGYQGLYEVSDMGRVRSLDRDGYSNRAGGIFKGITLSPFADSSSGYLYVNLSKLGKVRKTAVHILVLEAFVGSLPHPTMDACHDDGCRTNAKLKNLRWDTRVANAADKHRHGTAQVGERSRRAKLTEDQVAFILVSNLSSLKLAKQFGVAGSTIRAIRIGQNWRYSTGLNRAIKMEIEQQELEEA
jgi:hypothetical protein